MSPESVPPPVPEYPGATSLPKRKGLHGCAIAAIVGVVVFVVLIVVAVLAGLALPIINSARKKGKQAEAGILAQRDRTLAQQIANSVKGYYAEYSKYPVPPGHAAGEDTPILTDDAFTQILMGRDTKLNPKKILFLPGLRLVEAGGGGPGLRTDGSDTTIVDLWGHPYNVIIDIDYSGDIANPDASSPNTTLYQGVLVWSSGPDGDPTTWSDNVISWETRKK